MGARASRYLRKQIGLACEFKRPLTSTTTIDQFISSPRTGADLIHRGGDL